ncbi:MAG: sigma-54-dependent Fis family transcriptional regulator [Planctomycetes bacterium]|nr:sigma-54-dependent Fis family transcriptional regulator [Planctomycetota bacterium]
MPYKASILLVDDEEDYRAIIMDHLEARGYSVAGAASAAEAIRLATTMDFNLALLDIRMPETNGLELLRALKAVDPNLDVIMLTGHATVETAIEAMKQGAVDYLRKPARLTELEAVIERTLAVQCLRQETFQLRERLRLSEKFPQIVGESKAIGKVLKQIAQVAQTDTTVLIQGETGTGKELVAHAIHQASPRAQKPFVVLNCGAFQETLLENELFGHEKGAFTGADTAKPGILEVANLGSLFVDEVGEMTLGAQVRFLRFLEKGDFRRLGSNRDLRVDIRVIAATNRNLEAEVRKKRFREDLFFRLNVFLVDVPPLRQRKEDIPFLVRHLISSSSIIPARKTEVSAEALECLMDYDWPGNVRELANVVERALITCRQGKIHAYDLTLRPGWFAEIVPNQDALESLEAVERNHIEKVIRSVKGNKRRAAHVLGISIRNLYRKLERYGLAAAENPVEDKTA